jgi:malonyl CoA-acyl carrier protein transacylase
MPISHRKPVAPQLDITLTEEQRSLLQIYFEIAIDKFEANAIAAALDNPRLNDQFNRQHTQTVDWMERFGAAGAVILTPDEGA